MEFISELKMGIFVKRYKRFLVDIKLNNGDIITAHCPNTGSMKNCLYPGWKVLLSESSNLKRKYKYTFEMIHNGKCWIGVNTHLTNKIILEAINEKQISEFDSYNRIKTEVPYGNNSRIDILLEDDNDKTYIEIKNVTLVEDSIFYFPDSITKRGQKHLKELILMRKNGNRAVIFFLIQRTDGNLFKPASHIDKEYSKLLSLAVKNGVEVLAYNSIINSKGISLGRKIKCTDLNKSGII